ncbi:MAG: VOC family protein [Alphaproteobacteria bacterium]
MNPTEAAAVAARQVPTGDATVIDHLAHWVPDEAAASARLEALGFTLAPLSHQVTRAGPDAPPVSAGTANRTIMLQQGYIEILTTTGDTPNARTLQKGMARYVGVHLIAFGLADPDATSARLTTAGFEPLPVVRLEREIETESGAPGHVRFRVLRVAPEAMPEGRIQFCKHLTPENMWQGRWLDHANGATGLASILIAVPDPDETTARLGRFLGRAATTRADGARQWSLERGSLVVTDAAGATRLTGAAVPTTPCMAAYALTVADLGATGAHLQRNGIPGAVAGDALTVDAGPAVGGRIAFVASATAVPWLG